MHRWLLLMIGISALAACGPKAPINCERVKQQLYGCIDRSQSGEMRQCLEYIPLSATARYHGTWANTFEFSHFTNGKILKPEEAFVYQASPIELAVEDTELDKFWTADRARVMEIDFIGRKQLCNLAAPATYITVDRVITARTIENRPSGW